MIGIGKTLSQVITIWKTLKAFPWLIKLIKHHREVKSALESLRDFVESARVNRGLPSRDATVHMLGEVQVIFEKEIVDFPDLDEQVFAETLREIRANIVASHERARSNQLGGFHESK